MFVFKHLDHGESSTGDVLVYSKEPIGYIEYDRYIIPLILAEYNDTKSKKKINIDIFMNEMDLIFNFRYECITRSGYGNIVIGKSPLRVLSDDDITSILYHEIGHILSPIYFEETEADRFATMHVGSKRMIESLSKFERLRYSFRKALLHDMMNHPENNNPDFIIDLQLISDGALTLQRREMIERIRVDSRLPKMKLYLHEETLNRCRDEGEK